MSVNHKALALLLPVLLSGCQTPFLVFPGGEIQAIASEADSFAFARDHATLVLEVDADGPYSVILRTTVIEGELYIDAAPARRWGQALAANTAQPDPERQRVRIKLGDRVYAARAEVVTDPAVVDQFLSGRTIYRIVPVTGSP